MAAISSADAGAARFSARIDELPAAPGHGMRPVRAVAVPPLSGVGIITKQLSAPPPSDAERLLCRDGCDPSTPAQTSSVRRVACAMLGTDTCLVGRGYLGIRTCNNDSPAD